MFPLYTLCWESFFLIINRCWILSNTFIASFDMIICFLSFILFTWSVTLIDCSYCITLHPGINSTWSGCIILLMDCWIWFANILLRIFALMFIWDIGLYFFLVLAFELSSKINLFLYKLPGNLVRWRKKVGNLCKGEFLM